MAVQARFFVDQITKHARFEGSKFTLSPVTSSKPGNSDWSKYTPSGTIELNVTNPDAIAWFEDRLGKDIAITFDDRPEEETM